MLEVANVEHALFVVSRQAYSLRRFPATGLGPSEDRLSRDGFMAVGV